MKVILTLCFCLALTLKISAQYQIFPILDTKIGAVLGGARVQLEEPYAADFVDAANRRQIYYKSNGVQIRISGFRQKLQQKNNSNRQKARRLPRISFGQTRFFDKFVRRKN